MKQSMSMTDHIFSWRSSCGQKSHEASLSGLHLCHSEIWWCYHVQGKLSIKSLPHVHY